MPLDTAAPYAASAPVLGAIAPSLMGPSSAMAGKTNDSAITRAANRDSVYFILWFLQLLILDVPMEPSALPLRVCAATGRSRQVLPHVRYFTVSWDSRQSAQRAIYGEICIFIRILTKKTKRMQPGGCSGVNMDHEAVSGGRQTCPAASARRQQIRQQRLPICRCFCPASRKAWPKASQDEASGKASTKGPGNRTRVLRETVPASLLIGRSNMRSMSFISGTTIYPPAQGLSSPIRLALNWFLR